MRTGEMRNRIIFQRPTYSRSSFNELEESFTYVATVWAAIEWSSGRRYEAAKQFDAEIQGVIRIRYRSDIQPTWRIKYGNRYISILSIANVFEQGRELQLNCKEWQD